MPAFGKASVCREFLPSGPQPSCEACCPLSSLRRQAWLLICPIFFSTVIFLHLYFMPGKAPGPLSHILVSLNPPWGIMLWKWPLGYDWARSGEVESDHLLLKKKWLKVNYLGEEKAEFGNEMPPLLVPSEGSASKGSDPRQGFRKTHTLSIKVNRTASWKTTSWNQRSCCCGQCRASHTALCLELQDADTLAWPPLGCPGMPTFIFEALIYLLTHCLTCLTNHQGGQTFPSKLFKNAPQELDAGPSISFRRGAVCVYIRNRILCFLTQEQQLELHKLYDVITAFCRGNIIKTLLWCIMQSKCKFWDI